MTYIEVRIKACTGEYTLLKCDTGDLMKDRQEAAQIASTIRTLARTGRPIYQMSSAPADWFAGFGDNAHVAEIKVMRVRVVASYLNSLDTEKQLHDPMRLRTTLSDTKFDCEHQDLAPINA